MTGARTFSTALSIARAAANGDAAIGRRYMSELLHDVLAQDGGFMGLSDAGFDAFCARNAQYVDRDIAMKAQWARTIKWPRSEEDDREIASWRSTWERMQAWQARQQTRMAAE